MTQFATKSFSMTRLYLPFSHIKYVSNSFLTDEVLNYEGCNYDVNKDKNEITIFSENEADLSLTEHIANVLIEKLKQMDEKHRNNKSGNY